MLLALPEADAVLRAHRATRLPSAATGASGGAALVTATCPSIKPRKVTFLSGTARLAASRNTPSTDPGRSDASALSADGAEFSGLVRKLVSDAMVSALDKEHVCGRRRGRQRRCEQQDRPREHPDACRRGPPSAD